MASMTVQTERHATGHGRDAGDTRDRRDPAGDPRRRAQTARARGAPYLLLVPARWP